MGSMISVVVPVYNSEKTLARCVDSLIAAAVEEYEIILVDDGATDNSAGIIDEYAGKYSYIHAVHQENRGLSGARNSGMRAARGEYISFVDADDYVEPDIYSRCRQLIERCEPDMIHFRFFVHDLEGKDLKPQYNSLERDKLLNREYIEEYIIPAIISADDKADYFIDNFAWNKLYKKSIIDEHGLEFDESRRMWEDRLFLASFSRYINSLYCMSEELYYYVITPNSLGRQIKPELLRNVSRSYELYSLYYGNCYDLRRPYTVNYFCGVYHSVLGKFFDSGSLVSELLKTAIADFAADETARTLYSLFEPKNSSEKAEREAVLSGSAEKICDYFIALSRREAQKAKLQKYLALPIRIKNGIIRRMSQWGRLIRK